MSIQTTPLPIFFHGGRHYYETTPEQLLNSGVPASEVLAEVKRLAKAEVDTADEAARSVFVTPGAGQAMEYQEAQSQAAEAVRDPAPVAGRYPMLEASIGIDIDPETGALATDVKGVARSIYAAFSAFVQIGSVIRAVRLKAKAEIDAASSIAEVEAVRAAIKWPSVS